jgi:hypothetical protein
MESERFLKVFNIETRNHIIEFGKTVSLVNADVFILMARKATCFIDCMRSLSLINLDGVVTSERVLDLDTSWLRGKDICIIDDSIISGTTINKTIETLSSIGVGKIIVHAVSINKKWFQVDNVRSGLTGNLYLKPPYLEQADEESIRQCKDIVKSISIFPRPYDVDFPYSKNIKIKESEFRLLRRLDEFQIFDISTEIQRSNDIFAFTLIPGNFFSNRFCKLFDGGLGGFCQLKIRIYGKKSIKSDSIILRVVPIVIIDPLHKDDLDSIFSSMFSAEEEKAVSKVQFSTHRSRFRLVQFLIAERLGKSFFQSLSVLFHRDLSFSINDDALSLIFSETSMRIINSIRYNDVLPRVFIHRGDIETSVYPEQFVADDFYSNDIETINARLISPFMWLYENWEIPTRKDILEGKNESNYSIEKHERLNIGFSFSALKSLVSQVSSFDMGLYVSTFLDRLIDLGIVVPVTVDSGDIVYRGFRHGEDVVFGVEQERLAGLMLESYRKAVGADVIQKFETQKLLVLLLQVGIRLPGDFISLYDPRKGYAEGSRIASVKYYLHGPVVTERSVDLDSEPGKPYLSSDFTNSWLTSSLASKPKKVIEFDVEKKGFVVKNLPHIQLSTKNEIRAANIGEMFGTLISNYKKHAVPSLDPNTDLVSLTACIDPNTIIGALSAEMFIFVDKWDEHMSPNIKALLDLQGGIEEANLIRKREYMFFTALNSGIFKYNKFISNDADKVIRRISDWYYDNECNYQFEQWIDMWPKSTAWSETSVEPGRWKLILDMGIWILSCTSYVLIVEYLCIGSSSLNSSEKKKRQDSTVKELLTCYSQLSKYSVSKRTEAILPYLHDVIVSIRSGHYSYRRASVKILIKNIQKLIYYAKPLLESAEMYCMEYGKELAIYDYSYSVIFQFKSNLSSHQQQEHLFDLEDYIRSVISETRKHSHNEFEMRILPDNFNRVEGGKVVLNTGNTSNTFAVNLAVNVCMHFSERLHVRALVFGQIPKEARIKYIGNTNSSIKSGHFWKYIHKFFRIVDRSGEGSKVFLAVEKSPLFVDEFGKINAEKLRHIERVSQRDIVVDEAIGSAIQLSVLNLKGKSMKSDNTTFNIGQVNGPVGDNRGSTIIQSFQEVSNNQDNLVKYLLGNGLGASELDELRCALNSDPRPEKLDDFGEHTRAWISKMLAKAVDGSWSISVATAGNVLATAINAYYGLIK